ncbi:OB-fold domain-containing protein [Sinimarinibacterium flocculans]|uniref:OB-fold domain-containing protein n=1 Tax=Sinimarinibacterium flocculans TaxID=985250 RepID=UPI002492B8A5|nr:OB-fold domain-containing protein [Sinimarinibacterium flocculans]
MPWRRLERAAIARAHHWYNPGLRGLGKGQRAIASWDEDAVTMAVEASRVAMAGAVSAPSRLLLASTTLPFADRQNAGLIKEALDLPDAVASVDVAGSRRAGTSALLLALSSAGDSLCVASEKPRTQPASEAELAAGDAAAAFRVGSGEGVARFVGGHSVTVDFVDQFRAAGSEFDYAWEARWVREEGYGRLVGGAIGEALRRHGIDAASVHHFLLAAPMGGVAVRAARTAGIPERAVHPGLQAEVGHAGVAAALLLLAHCLEQAGPGELIVLVGFGQGCDVLIFRTTSALAGQQVRRPLKVLLDGGRGTDNYFRYLTINGLLDVERGMRAEMDMKTALTGLYRDRRAVLGLVGGRNRRTGTVQYPRSPVPVDAIDGRIGDWEDYRFADRPARIVSFTADRLAFSIDPPGYYGMVDFEGGGRITADFADMDAVDAVVGREMRMVFRIKAQDESRGFTRYFWKATPLRATFGD